MNIRSLEGLDAGSPVKGEAEHMSLCVRAHTPSLRRPFAAVLTLVVVCAFLAFPSAASANPPKSVDLAYDKTKGELSVTITHTSFFPSKHYIKSVAVSVNGKEVLTTPYTTQPSGYNFTYTYPVKAAPGDVISAVATCNIFGSTEGKVTAP
jgi:hypothetical protein